MPRDALVFEILVASPDDLRDERELIHEVARDWNATNSRSLGCVLETVGWERHVSPSLADRAQGVINTAIVDSADVVIALFWTKFGVGTGEEIERAHKAGKPVLLYFSNRPIAPDAVDQEKYRQLQEFKKRCQERGLYSTFASLGELAEKLGRDLGRTIHGLRSSAAPVERPESARARPRVSTYALELLRAENPSGSFFVLHPSSHGGGRIVHAGDSRFGSPEEPETGARYVSGLEELRREGLIERDHTQSHPHFNLTAAGWDAKNLTSRDPSVS